MQIKMKLNVFIFRISNSNFYIYGTVMNAFTTLSFYSQNVFIDTTNLIGGYVFVTSCTLGVDNVINEVVIDGLKMDGLRQTLFTYGGLYMTGT